MRLAKDVISAGLPKDITRRRPDNGAPVRVREDGVEVDVEQWCVVSVEKMVKREPVDHWWLPQPR